MNENGVTISLEEGKKSCQSFEAEKYGEAEKYIETGVFTSGLFISFAI